MSKKSYYFPGLGGISASLLEKTEYFREERYNDKGDYTLEGKDKQDHRTFWFCAAQSIIREQAPKIHEAINEVRNSQ